MSTVQTDFGRLLATPTPDLATHVAVHGRLPEIDPQRMLAEVRTSGLTGRGGAGFPTVVKLEAVKLEAVTGRSPVVVGNAAEGEPASLKDRQLLFGSPHLVLDGVQIAARIVGATEAYVYVRADAAQALNRAVSERRDHLPVEVVVAGEGFVSGQETAVVSRLNGGAPLPVFSRKRVVEQGVGGRPTLVQNIETLAHLALLARHGGAWFAGTGSEGATGTFLATVHSTKGMEPRVWEVPHGMLLGQLLRVAGEHEQLQAVLVGGYHGTWLPLPAAAEVPLSADGLKPFGSSLGAGVLIPITVDQCGLEVTARIVRYLAAESARQCGPCLFGLPNLARHLSELAAGRAGAPGLRTVREAAGLVVGRGACHHPDGTARLVRSALVAFERDAVMHAHGRCIARIAEPYGGQLS